ncbi:MAG: hypothetical protein EAZ99_16835 [Alphaproteobacteria bacterium]|nr:MAG: hypothetical protein EAZ99_16835 [Alphaproteobacteria bacterium]
MDVTPLIPAGRQVLERYGNGGFRITGVMWQGPVLVHPTRTEAAPLLDAAALSLDSFGFLLDPAFGVQVLLIGGGRSTPFLPLPLRAALRERGVVAEPMDTGAACRTYSILLAEDRPVAAALIPVG